MLDHIKELLKEHDCVVIPGLGGLIGHYEPARRNLASGTMSPPMKRVAFNRALRQNDGMLIHFVARRAGVAYVEAEKTVAEFRETVEQALRQNGSFLFSGIGKLTYDEDQNLQFHPILKENLLLDTFGLPLVVAQPVQRIREAATAEAVTPVIEKSPEVEETVAVPHHQEETPQIPTYRPWMFRAAAVVGLAFMMTTAMTSLFRGDVNSAHLSVLPVPVQELTASEAAVSERPALTMDETSFRLFTPTVRVVEEAAELPSATTVQTETAMDRSFQVIVGSFLDDVRLNREIKTMRQLGYQVTTVPGPGGYTRVALIFTDASGGPVSTLQDIRHKVNPDAWMIGP